MIRFIVLSSYNVGVHKQLHNRWFVKQFCNVTKRSQTRLRVERSNPSNQSEPKFPRIGAGDGVRSSRPKVKPGFL
jgi:hypothetical protein